MQEIYYNDLRNTLLLLGFSFLLFGCSKEEADKMPAPVVEQEDKEKKLAEEAEKRSAEIDAFDITIASKPLPYEEAYKTTKKEDIGKEKVVEEKTPEVSGDYSCTTVKYKATAEYNENILLYPGADVFFPGSMLKGESIESGGYIPIGIDNRSDMTMSVSLPNIQGKVSAEFTPSLSDTRQKITEILNQEIKGSTPARVNFIIESVYNKEQLNLAIGAGFQYSGGITNVDISSQFNFTETTTKSRFLVKYIQEYYSVDVNPRRRASDYFKDIKKEDPKHLKGMPLYVSSVKYGRMVMFSVESTDSEQNVRAALQASFSNLTVSADASVEAEHSQVLNESTIKATIIGGSGAKAAQAISGVDGIKAFISEGGDYSQDSPAAVLAYTLRSISDNSVMKSLLASEYSVRNCKLVTGRYKLTFLRINKIHLGGGKIEFYGYIYVKFNDKLKMPLSSQISGLTPQVSIMNLVRKEWVSLHPDPNYNIYDLSKQATNNNLIATYDKDSPASITLTAELADIDSNGDSIIRKQSTTIDLKKVKLGQELSFKVATPGLYATIVYKVEALPYRDI